MGKWVVCTLAVLLTASLALQAEDSKEKKKEPPKKKANPAYTSAKEAGPDFAVQGEYEAAVQGEYEASAPAGKMGVQVIAEGDGKFAIRILAGGLPGAGWDGKRFVIGSGKTEGGKVVIATRKSTGEISGGKLTSTDAKGATGVFKRVERKSPTLDAKAPSGAVVLFDGTSADAWQGGKLVMGNLLNNGIKSKQKFKDHKIHVEFILPFMPFGRGQGRANSGVYLQDRYELQVLDSFGLKGENNECGGFYQQYAPLVNMCYPPLAWQTYDIDFKAARFDASGKKTADAVATVLQNGVLIQDHVKLKGSTGGGQKEADTPGPIQLQNHGNPVYYRNIWVVEMK